MWTLGVWKGRKEREWRGDKKGARGDSVTMVHFLDLSGSCPHGHIDFVLGMEEKSNTLIYFPKLWKMHFVIWLLWI